MSLKTLRTHHLRAGPAQLQQLGGLLALVRAEPLGPLEAEVGGLLRGAEVAAEGGQRPAPAHRHVGLLHPAQRGAQHPHQPRHLRVKIFSTQSIILLSHTCIFFIQVVGYTILV